jgi:hypothetical protein
LSGPLTIAFATWRGAWLYPWYVVFALPGAAALVALGVEPLAEALGTRPGRLAARALALACVAGFGVLAWPVLSDLRTRPLQPNRESVLLTRPTLDPFAPENAKILTATFQGAPSYYDPRIVFVRTPGRLRRLMARADESGLTLYVNYGRPKLARERYPKLVQFVERRDLFEPVATLVGADPRGVRHVLRYRGRAGRESRRPEREEPAAW